MTISSFYDLVYFTTATTGTGSITVGSAVSGARTPAQASVPDGTVISYSIIDGANFEVGQGTYTVSGTVLSRDSVTASSNSGSKINLSGSAVVSFTVLGADLLSFGERMFKRIITSGSQSTIDFTNIPSGWSSLRAQVLAQDTVAGTSVSGLFIMMNGDNNSSNYGSCGRIDAENGAVGSSVLAATAKGGRCGSLTQSGNTNMVVQNDIMFVGYAGTTWHKQAMVTWCSDGGILFAGIMGFRWKSTAAINRLTFGTDGTAFSDGSVATLYLLP